MKRYYYIQTSGDYLVKIPRESKEPMCLINANDVNINTNDFNLINVLSRKGMAEARAVARKAGLRLRDHQHMATRLEE